MKKAFAVLFAVVLFLCGCGDTKKVPIRIGDTEFRAIITQNNEQNYTIDIKTDKKLKNISGTIKKPENLSGVEFTVSGEMLNIDYNGLNIKKDIGELPQDNTPVLIFKAIKSANGKNAVCEDGNYIFNGSIEDEKYTLSVTPSGLPMLLKFKNNGIKIEFRNLTLVK